MRTVATLLICGLLLTACSSVSAPPPRPEPSVALPAPAPEVKLTVTGGWPQRPAWHQPDVPLTAELPTFPAESRKQWPAGLKPPGLPGGLADLEALAAQLEGGGGPEVPKGVNAVLVGAMGGGTQQVYYLGGPPRPDIPTVYVLSKATQGWSATPICEGARWIWPGTREMPAEPIVLCGSSEGSGGVLYVTAYQGDREIFRAGGLQEGVLAVGAPSPDGPPQITLTGKREWMDHKLDPWVAERFTFTWKDGAYTQTRHERMSDWVYHLARFDRFLADGNLAGATKEMASVPAEGLAAYLRRSAPAFQAAAGGRWTTDGFSRPTGGVQRLYLHAPRVDGAPWFWFEFSPDGLITALGQQTDAPR